MKAKVLDLINPTKGVFRDADYTMKGLDAVLKVSGKELWIKNVQPIYADDGPMSKNVPFFILASDNFLEVKHKKLPQLFNKKPKKGEKEAPPIILNVDPNSFEVKGVISKADMAAIAEWGAIRAANDHWTRGPGLLEQMSGNVWFVLFVLAAGVAVGIQMGWISF